MLSCQTFSDAMPDTPEETKNLVLNASLDINGCRLQLSDNAPQGPYALGTNMTAALQVSTTVESQRLFVALSKNAMRIELPLQETPWSPAYGIVVDKFGMTWQINTDIENYVPRMSF